MLPIGRFSISAISVYDGQLSDISRRISRWYRPGSRRSACSVEGSYSPSTG
jgi:hypothetical protein